MERTVYMIQDKLDIKDREIRIGKDENIMLR